MQKYACFLDNPVTDNNFTFLYNCTSAGHSVKDPIYIVPVWHPVVYVLVGTTVVQLMFFFFVFKLHNILVLMFLSSSHVVSVKRWGTMCMFSVMLHQWVKEPSPKLKNLLSVLRYRLPRFRGNRQNQRVTTFWRHKSIKIDRLNYKFVSNCGPFRSNNKTW